MAKSVEKKSNNTSEEKNFDFIHTCLYAHVRTCARNPLKIKEKTPFFLSCKKKISFHVKLLQDKKISRRGTTGERFNDCRFSKRTYDRKP